MHVRYPVWLRLVHQPGATVFAAMFALESVARALLASVIPVQALAILESPETMSWVFAAVGLMGLVASFTIPVLIGRITRRWTYTLGTVLLILAPAALATIAMPGLVAGMLLRVYGVACLSITLSLYIMQYVNRRDLTRAEPRRLVFSAAAWTVGPALGVKLYADVGPDWAFAGSGAAAALLLVYFWALKLKDSPALPRARKPPPNPLRNIGRFLAQPRLRLAWMIVFGRSSWWVFFFIYTPVYMVTSGYDAVTAALLVSAGNGMLFLSPLFGRLGARFGIRRVLLAAFLLVGSATLMAGLCFAVPVAGAAFLLLAALGCVALDAVGNIPFFRAVHAHERPEMTTVFRTYIDVSDLVPPALFALLLSAFDLQAVFIAAGLGLLSFAWWTRYIPRRM